MKSQKKKAKKKAFNVKAFMILVVVLLVAYIGVSLYFQKHFFFHTKVNGIDVACATVEKVQERIKKETSSYELTVYQRGDISDNFKGKDIDLQPVFDGGIEKLLKEQNGFGWIGSLFKETELISETAVEYDAAKLKNVVAGFKGLSSQVAPEDAGLSEYKEGAGYEIIPEIEGNTVDQTRMYQVLDEAILNLQEKVSFEDKDCYVRPSVTKDDEGLNARLANLNRCVNAKITYTFGDKTEVLDGSTLKDWLIVQADNSVVVSNDALTEYVSQLVSAHNTVFRNRTLATSYGQTVTITDGDYGWWIDKDGEKQQLLNDITQGNVTEREPVYKQRANSFGTNDYGNTYVEINLTAQHLYFYKNGSLIIDSDFVSGNISKGNGTPVGAYGVTYTQRDATLKGQNYETPVSYWMPFNNNVGMHDANWRDDFGGNIYKTNGSHGCINLPPAVAKKIFENIETGDAVLVYELPGTESEKAKAQDSAAVVSAAINSIGTVTLDSEATINSVQKQYDALSDMAKGYVKNYATLQEAQTTLQQLKAEAEAQTTDPATETQAGEEKATETGTDGQNNGE